jgi:hypothetical protein
MRNPFRRRFPKLSGHPQIVEFNGRLMQIVAIQTSWSWGETRVSLELADDSDAPLPGSVFVRGAEGSGHAE